MSVAVSMRHIGSIGLAGQEDIGNCMPETSIVRTASLEESYGNRVEYEGMRVPIGFTGGVCTSHACSCIGRVGLGGLL